MTNFDYVQKTIDIFEDSLVSGAPVTTVRELSAKIGYSSHHLGRLFQSLCGEPLGRYMLRRRLAEAVLLIRDGGVAAAETGQRLGWEDYSSFSRAIRKEFGLSPGNLKTPGVKIPSQAVRARPSLTDPGVGAALLSPEYLVIKSMHVSGLVFYMSPNEKTFHRPWRIFENHRKQLRGMTGPATYQFSSWTEESEPDEGIWIHCAVETDPALIQAPVFFSREIPETVILRFVHTGPVERIYDTYRRIWEEYLPRSTFRLCGSWEFQKYPDPSEPARIEICLPVTGA